MSKAILILDMPENCIDCPCSFFEESSYSFDLTCVVTQASVNSCGKSDYCPLRELPQKVDIHKAKTMTTLNWCEGYNACIDEIMKGVE